ncbi:methyl-accepting chemotaxis protein [Ideonella sp.]|uniref:methyl-accepting chemotaxis protein n=1 Tax=Ideonella sp. TaxID=1929293 RepID=UPI003BB67FF3
MIEWLIRFRLRTRLLGAFLLVAGIGALIGGLGLHASAALNAGATRMYEREMASLRQVAEANTQMLLAALKLRAAVLSVTPQQREAEARQAEAALQAMERELGLAHYAFQLPEGKALYEATKGNLAQFQQGVRQVLQELPKMPVADANAAITLINDRVTGPASLADEQMGKLMARKVERAGQINEANQSLYQRMRLSLILTTLGGTLLGVLLGVMLTRSVERQLGGEPTDVVRAVQAIAQGDMSGNLNGHQAPAGSVVRAMGEMQQSLRHIVSTVRQSSEGVTNGASEIALGTQDLSHRTEAQASTLEQTAAAMEHLSGSVNQNAEAAGEASRLADGARGVATQGQALVGQVVGVMNQIQTASQRIAQIIGVIDGIAFQTNILALNAAVEAARAGEQGRGFAVVAQEVRELAGRSATAAREIRSLIGSSVETVEGGSRLVEQAGGTMQDIVAQVERVAQFVGEISGASGEQARSLKEIHTAVRSLDQMTQQNSALVEESAAASESLKSQAQRLLSVVATFRLGGSAQPA